MTSLSVTPVACLTDNYAYLIVGDDPTLALVVDPSEAAPVEAALASGGLLLAGILLTHHHFDHIGGVGELAAARPGLPVYGFSKDAARLPGLTHGLRDGDELSLLGLRITALHVPGHTTGALAYSVSSLDGTAAVFTGDTLFAAGCGRMFEGTKEGMRRSLVEVLGALPDDTAVYCGHEYTEANLRFAATVEPDNADVLAAQATARAQRSRGAPTVPSSIAHERRTNPFLRDHVPAVRAFVDAGPEAAPADVFGALRRAKDVFR
jgi:hydroxyacylglutathione hydrolase